MGLKSGVNMETANSGEDKAFESWGLSVPQWKICKNQMANSRLHGSSLAEKLWIR